MRSDARSATMIVGAFVLPPGITGNTEASTTRRASTREPEAGSRQPRRRRRRSSGRCPTGGRAGTGADVGQPRARPARSPPGPGFSSRDDRARERLLSGDLAGEPHPGDQRVDVGGGGERVGQDPRLGSRVSRAQRTEPRDSGLTSTGPITIASPSNSSRP